MIAEVMPGYKQTEAGVIPTDWKIHQLVELSSSIASGRSKVDAEFGQFPVFGSTGVIGYTNTPSHAGESILVARVGANAGFLNSADGRYGVTDNTIAIRLKTGFDHIYCLLQLKRYGLSRLIFGSGQPLITGTQLKGIPIPTPTPEEQVNIVSALSDIDALIRSLDQLIAKKRDIQQAAMQQLLTGQLRLPGFSGEWEVKRLGEICAMKSGEGITSANIDEHSEYPCYGGNGLRGQTDTYTHDGSYVLIGRQGALCGNIVLVRGRFFASEHAIVATPFSQTDVSWLSIVLRKMNLNQYSESSAQPGLSVSKLLLLQCLVPPLPEQTTIATILSDMDAELATLEARRDKARQLKQGMMQELLTGRIRLINSAL